MLTDVLVLALHADPLLFHFQRLFLRVSNHRLPPVKLSQVPAGGCGVGIPCSSCGLWLAPSKAAALTPFLVAVHGTACEGLTPDPYGGRGSTFQTREATLGLPVLRLAASQRVPRESPGLGSVGGGRLTKPRETFTGATTVKRPKTKRRAGKSHLAPLPVLPVLTPFSRLLQKQPDPPPLCDQKDSPNSHPNPHGHDSQAARGERAAAALPLRAGPPSSSPG